MAININIKGLSGVLFQNVSVDEVNDTVSDLVGYAEALEDTPSNLIDTTYYGNVYLTRDQSINTGTAGSLTSLGIVAGDTFHCVFNDDATTYTKEQRQVRKLNLASIKRAGLAAQDTTKAYYRSNNTYDLTTLPDTYNGNVPGADDNPNTGGLVPKRPWVSVGAIAAPTSIQESVDGGSITDLEIWYDGADTSTIVPTGIADEDNINQWNDKSGLAHNLNFDGGANKPTYESSDTQNGYGYVQFADGDLMSINPLASLSLATAYTVFVIARPTSLATNSPQLLTSTENGELSIQIDSDGTARFKVGNDSATTAAGTVVEDKWYVFTLVFNGAQTRIDGRVNDGSLPNPPGQTITTTFMITAPNQLNPGSTYLYVGGDNTGGTFIGDIGEVILFKKALNSTEYANVENYLTNKWGI